MKLIDHGPSPTVTAPGLCFLFLSDVNPKSGLVTIISLVNSSSHTVNACGTGGSVEPARCVTVHQGSTGPVITNDHSYI